MINGYDLKIIYNEKEDKIIRKPEGKEIYLFGRGTDKKRENIFKKLKKHNLFFHKLFFALKHKFLKLKLDLIKYYHIDTFYETNLKEARQIKKENKKVEIFLPVPDFPNLNQHNEIQEKLKSFNNENIS